MISESSLLTPIVFPELKAREEAPSQSLENSIKYGKIDLKICAELSLRDLCSLRLVCKEWKQIAQATDLWKWRWSKDFKINFSTIKQPRSSASKKGTFKESSSFNPLSSKIYEKLLLSFDNLTPDELKKNIESNEFLSKASIEKAEKAYTQALKRAIQKKDPIQESLYIERLGDLHVRKATSETLLQAAGLYNYALHNAPLGEQAIIKEKLSKVEILLSKACTGEPVDIPKIKKQSGNNREGLKKFRDEIEEKIQALGPDPSPEEVRKLFGEITQQIKAFFEILVKQSVDALGAEPCEYAMIGFGSLAREEVTPYSDLEFGILIKEDNPTNREYFKRLASLIHLKVINLGETILPALNIPCLQAMDFFDGITPRGFAFDGAGVEGKGCKTPFGNDGNTFELIQTPERMAQYIAKDEHGKWWHKKEPHLPMELLTFTHLLGNLELTEQYSKALQKTLDIPCQGDLSLRQYLAKQHLVLADMEAFDPRLGDLDRHGMLFKVKNDFYRFPHLALDRLALLKRIAASNTFTRIDELNKLGVITEGATDKLKEWMSIALFMRLKTYSHYQKQQEIMNPLVKPFGFEDPALIKKQFALNQEELEKIKKIYSIFIPFYQIMQKFLAGNEEDLKFSDLNDNSFQTCGSIALRLFQYEEAKNFYLSAKLDDPEALSALGYIYRVRGDFSLAIESAHSALEKDRKLYGEDSPHVERDYNNLASVYKEQGDLDQALMYAEKAFQLNKGAKRENDLTLVKVYNNLGQIYQAKGDPDNSAKYSMEALNMGSKFLDKNHPSLAIVCNNLVMVSQEQGNLQQASEYAQKALKIDNNLYGENHLNVAIDYNTLGQVYKVEGKLELAAQYTKKACDIAIKILGKDHYDISIYYINLAMIYRDQEIINGDQGKLNLAAEYINRAYEIELRVKGENNPQLTSLYINLAVIKRDQGNLNEALVYAKKALKLDENHHGKENVATVADYYTLGLIYKDKRNFDKAIKYVMKARKINRDHYKKVLHDEANYYNILGEIYHAQTDLEKALKYTQKALAIDLKLFGGDHSSIADDYYKLGQIYKEKGNLCLAINHTKEALRISIGLYGIHHPRTVTIDANLQELHKIF
ncbi:hypothetical protein NEOC84_000406|uniref:tetratricopeptide repeat protein n=1 Tax=Neochlamydia sp. AcF84 TaxID=2315858 RepID=UPI00140B6A0D|nr:tetratricopeptide repeat protein [Neochlamydia sp. AcF84]NGY94525.1 hypothetical protein [Neochlamydia sp. AcF84]